jgi:hypothetical protein
MDERAAREQLSFHRWMHTRNIEPLRFWTTHFMREPHLKALAYHRHEARRAIQIIRENRNDNHQAGSATQRGAQAQRSERSLEGSVFA